MGTVIKNNQVRVDAAGKGAEVNRRRVHAKSAKLLEFEGQVRAIEFRCSCGDVTVLELDYDVADIAPTAPLPPTEPTEGETA